MILFALAVVGCRKEDNLLNDVNRPKNTVNNKKIKIDEKTQRQLDYLVNIRGHDRDSIIITDKYFSVDHVVYSREIEISKKVDEDIVLRGSIYRYNSGEKVIYRKDPLIVCIDPYKACPQSWNNAIIAAIDKWNALPGFSINFVFDKDFPPIDVIQVKYLSFSSVDWLKNSWDAAASAPMYGFPGKTLWINADHNLSTNQKCHAIMHELGHSINFGHTTSSWWGGRPCDAKTSIMYPANNDRTEFNACDIDFFTSYY